MSWSTAYINKNDALWKNSSLSPKIKEIKAFILFQDEISIQLKFSSSLNRVDFNNAFPESFLEKIDSHIYFLKTADKNLIQKLFYSINQFDFVDKTDEIAEFIKIDLHHDAKAIINFIQQGHGNFEDIINLAIQSVAPNTLWDLGQHCENALKDLKKAIACYQQVPKTNPHFQNSNAKILEILNILFNQTQQISFLTTEELKNYQELKLRCKLNLINDEQSQQNFDHYYHQLSGGLIDSPPIIKNVGANSMTLMALAEQTKTLKNEKSSLNEELAFAHLQIAQLEIQVTKLSEQLSTHKSKTTYQIFAEHNLLLPKQTEEVAYSPTPPTEVIIDIDSTSQINESTHSSNDKSDTSLLQDSFLNSVLTF